jgi:uncharacterized membrane protein
VSPTLVEVVDLFVRWVHVIAGIMWIGNSLLWNWLDRNLEAAAPGEVRVTPAPIGRIWLLHSGAFYHMEKTLLQGATFPARLHWFKWHAYTTWLSGFVLLLTVYWVGGRALLVDGTVADLAHRDGLILAVGGMIVAMVGYEYCHRIIALRSPRLATAWWLALLVAIAAIWVAAFHPRAAFLHVGAMIGTLMAGNVVFTIMPAQRELVALVARGGAPDGASEASRRAKAVSIDNNYFVFPVIALMVIGHFPAVTAASQPFLVLLLIVATGVGVRHLLNIRYTFRAWVPALGGVLAAGFAGILLLTQHPARAATPGGTVAGAGATVGVAGLPTDGDPPSWAQVQRIMDRRCATCHSATPSDVSLGTVPQGIPFDTPEQVRNWLGRIRVRAVETETMPPANHTRMTREERDALARWIAAGAPMP